MATLGHTCVMKPKSEYYSTTISEVNTVHPRGRRNHVYLLAAARPRCLIPVRHEHNGRLGGGGGVIQVLRNTTASGCTFWRHELAYCPALLGVTLE